jgi:hypothetical protein
MILKSFKGLMMRFKLFAFVAVLLASVLPATAQDSSTLNTISFNGYGFSYADNLPISNVNVNITRYGNGRPDAQLPGGPHPAHTRFDLFTDELTPDPTYYPWTDVTVRFYKTADAGSSYTKLQTLLKDRPLLTSANNSSLPLLLPSIASVAVEARAHYIETETVTGVSYIFYSTLSVGPISETSYLYTFQGLSNDGSTYVTVVAPLNTLVVPTMAAYDAFASEQDNDKFTAGYAAYFAEAATMVDEATPDQFTPNLDDLDAFVETITVK